MEVRSRAPTRTVNVMVAVAFSIILFSLAAIYVRITTNHSTGLQNNAYIRVTNCILSTPPATRGKVEIDSCYTTVEHDLNIKLQRYNNTDK